MEQGKMDLELLPDGRVRVIFHNGLVVMRMDMGLEDLDQMINALINARSIAAARLIQKGVVQ